MKSGKTQNVKWKDDGTVSLIQNDKEYGENGIPDPVDKKGKVKWSGKPKKSKTA